MRRIIVLLTLMLLANIGYAQEGWLIPFAAAYQPDVDKFNAVFARHGLPVAAKRQFGWGIEIRSATGGFLVGPLFFRTWHDASNTSFQLRSEALGIFGEIGLKLTPIRLLTLVPMIGIGGINHSFAIQERSGDKTLDSLIEHPGRVVNISPGMKLGGMAALELGLIARTNSGNYGLALRAGYLYSPLELVWRQSNGSEVTGVPDTRLGGLFFSAGLVLMPEPQTVSSYP
ncbi:MAG: hypothetical protein ABIK43_06620 [candidate division WOR-3 bacterium]